MNRLPLWSLPALLGLACSGCNSHSYHAEALQYVQVAGGALAARDACINEEDCTAKNLLFFEAGEVSIGGLRWGGVHVNVYDTKDSEVVEEIANMFKELHAKIKGPVVTLTVYSSKHTESKVEFRRVVFK